METIYLVSASSGYGEDYSVKSVCAFKDKKEAEYFIARMNKDAAIIEGLRSARNAFMSEWEKSNPEPPYNYNTYEADDMKSAQKWREAYQIESDRIAKILDLETWYADLGLGPYEREYVNFFISDLNIYDNSWEMKENKWKPADPVSTESEGCPSDTNPEE